MIIINIIVTLRRVDPGKDRHLSWQYCNLSVMSQMVRFEKVSHATGTSVRYHHVLMRLTRRQTLFVLEWTRIVDSGPAIMQS